ncbi:hypothetical protein HDV01_003458 [Terramyces sp. JEL0728]|nr:hypothetical protein HDV01_003458 [Terramyces sp. JEL0728]
MNEFSSSFAVLVTALESVKALNTQKKSPEPVRPVIQSMKRKHSFQDESESKHQRLTPDLSYRFAQTVNLIQPDHNSKISKRTMLHLERMANNNHVQLQSLVNQWNSKLEELDSNVSMITKNISDSYDDIQIIITRITNLIDWLVPDKQELRNVLPKYKYTEHVLDNLIRFVKIVEDMKSTNGQRYITGSLSRDTDVLLDLILTKKTLYGDSLRHDCLAWKVLGYPVQDLSSRVILFKDTIFNSIYHQLHQVTNALEHPQADWVKPLEIILKTVEIITETALFFNDFNQDLIKACFNLAEVYQEKSLDMVRSDIPDTKKCFIYENLTNLYTYFLLT